MTRHLATLSFHTSVPIGTRDAQPSFAFVGANHGLNALLSRWTARTLNKLRRTPSLSTPLRALRRTCKPHGLVSLHGIAAIHPAFSRKNEKAAASTVSPFQVVLPLAAHNSKSCLCITKTRFQWPDRLAGIKPGRTGGRFPTIASLKVTCATHTTTFLLRVIVTPAVYPRLVEFLHFDIQSTGQKSHCVNTTFWPSQCYVLIKQSDSPCPYQF